MALGDYILCCKCDVKLIYDGDRGNREWWEERFGAEPAILCPKCDKREWVGLTKDQFLEAARLAENGNYLVAFNRIQQWLKEGNA
jgi:hypothetical protein